MKQIRQLKFCTLIVSLLFTVIVSNNTAIGGESMNKSGPRFNSISEVPDDVWLRLSEKKIYFGHQSVGYNIMHGVEAVLKQNPLIKLRMVETYDPEKITTGMFAHSQIGYNYKPKTKTEGFAFLMKAGLGTTVDYAFHKYCYVDILAYSDVEDLFLNYKVTISKIKSKNPSAQIIHVTVPLSTLESGLKTKIKKMIGRPLAGFQSNIKRNQFNSKMIAEYEGKDPIFDLAKFESTLPDGSRSQFVNNGETYYALPAVYASDDGHLNEEGGTYIAEQLLLFLANVTES